MLPDIFSDGFHGSRSGHFGIISAQLLHVFFCFLLDTREQFRPLLRRCCGSSVPCKIKLCYVFQTIMDPLFSFPVEDGDTRHVLYLPKHDVLRQPIFLQADYEACKEDPSLRCFVGRYF